MIQIGLRSTKGKLRPGCCDTTRVAPGGNILEPGEHLAGEGHANGALMKIWVWVFVIGAILSTILVVSSGGIVNPNQPCRYQDQQQCSGQAPEQPQAL